MRLRYGDVFRFDRVLNTYFYTSNSDKLLQARLVFMRHGYLLRHYRGEREPYDEDYSLGTQRLLERALDQVNREFNIRSLFFVEDTSLRIESLSDKADFPGLRVKEWFSQTTFEELDRVLSLRGTDRTAIVKSDIGLFVPTLSRPLFFHGETIGTIATSGPTFEASVQYPWLTPCTFNGWFIPRGSTKRLGEMEFEESITFDFRVKALKELIDRLEEMNAALSLSPIFYTIRSKPSQRSNHQLSLLQESERDLLLVVGPKCAGKTTFSDYAVRSSGVITLEASAILRLIAGERGVEIENSQDALAFLATVGMDIVAERISVIVSRSEASSVVVTGLRTIEELLVLTRAFPQLRVVLIDADAKTRFERHIRRARDRDVRTFADFVQQDEQQARFGILRVAGLVSDVVVRNDGEIEQYQDRIDEIVDRSTQSDDAQEPERELQSELYRSLKALSQIGRAANCGEIAQMADDLGYPVRKYNTNRALKAVPEFATRIEARRQLLRYRISSSGQALLQLMEERTRRRSLRGDGLQRA